MLRQLSALAMFAVLAGPAAAQDRALIEQTIGAQLEAFNDDDVLEAWQYASPMIQRMFGFPDNFGMMVQQGYPMVWRNSDVEYLGLRDQEGRIIQTLRLKDDGGQTHVLEYEMIEMNGAWRINGVWIIPAPDVGA